VITNNEKLKINALSYTVNKTCFRSLYLFGALLGLWVFAPSTSLVRELFNLIPLHMLAFVALCVMAIIFLAAINYAFALSITILKALTGKDLMLTMESGRVIKQTVTIEKSKINYTLKKQNIIHRILNTADLHVFTAGVSAAGFVIKDINVNDIDKLNVSKLATASNA
jgi:uncharacterized membrane protein YdbT with pleckstrin-like domain